MFREMAPRCAPLPRGGNVNEEQVPPIPQPLRVPQANQLSNNDFRVAITTLTQTIASPKTPTPASRIKDFFRMNP